MTRPAQERPGERDIETGAEDAGYRSGSDANKGERLLLGTYVRMTFPTGVIEIRKCSDEELKTMLDEAREASKHLRKVGRVVGIVVAHRLQQMKEFLAYEELATWRRMNDFDRTAADDNHWASRPLPSTPQEYHASLRHEFQKLKDAISMPNEEFA